MSNSSKSIISGVAGILLILAAFRDLLSPLEAVLMILGVILLSLGATIADRDRRLMKEYNKMRTMHELRDSVKNKDETDDPQERTSC